MTITGSISGNPDRLVIGVLGRMVVAGKQQYESG